MTYIQILRRSVGDRLWGVEELSDVSLAIEAHWTGKMSTPSAGRRRNKPSISSAR